MFWYTFFKRYAWLVRMIVFFIMGLFVAFVIALYRIDLESLRGNIVTVLQDSTNMPIEIDGKISWHFSLSPEIELNGIRIKNADWAKNKDLFTAGKVMVRLDLLSLFKPKPAIRFIKIYDAKVVLEYNSKGESSVVYNNSQNSGNQSDTTDLGPEKYPIIKMPFSGLEIKNLEANIDGKKYKLASMGVHNYLKNNNVEYSGWVRPFKTNIPFVIQFSEYNAEQNIYPVRIAVATKADAIIIDLNLDGNKIPKDFVVSGDIPDVEKISDWFNLGVLDLPAMKLDISGSIDSKKLTFKKSSVSLANSVINFSGTYDWSRKVPVLKATLSSDNINLYKSFPEWYGVGKEWIHPDRELNAFHDMPLFGEYLYGMDIDVKIKLKKFVVYRSLALTNMDVSLRVLNNKVDVGATTGIASGDINAFITGTVDAKGVYTLRAAAHGNHIYIGSIMDEIYIKDIISGLPLNVDLYVEAKGADMSSIMQTITGPVMVYSVDRGFAHSDLVAYMYGGDFLTNLRHGLEDMFTGNKRDLIQINSAIVNVILRNGLIETENGVAVETQVMNLRLAGTLDLGKETIQLSLASVPVRGLKISLSGNLVNALQITGNLSEPDFKISGAAVAGKVGSAVGLGLLLAPLTGGLSIAGGVVAGFFAGDLLDSWLADDHPYDTAMFKGAPKRPGDPEWMRKTPPELAADLLRQKK